MIALCYVVFSFVRRTGGFVDIVFDIDDVLIDENE